MVYNITYVSLYFRILVLDKGRVAEFDTPANLQARRGIFHGMACSAGLSKIPS